MVLHHLKSFNRIVVLGQCNHTYVRLRSFQHNCRYICRKRRNETITTKGSSSRFYFEDGLYRILLYPHFIVYKDFTTSWQRGHNLSSSPTAPNASL